MQLPVVFRPTYFSLPPMYTWPPAVKRAMLIMAIFGVIAAYVLLAGGVIAFLAVFAQWLG
jgi:hypothetical protein